MGSDDIQIEAVDYHGFKIKTLAGEQRLFLLLHQGDLDAIDVTDEAKLGRFLIIDL